MKTTIVKTKDNVELKTKEGELMYEHTLELGDEFIPQYNSVMEKSHEAVVKDKKKVITSYKIVAVVRTKDGIIKNEKGEDTHFITLTPTQAKALKKKIEAGIEINQHVFSTYTYENDFGEQLGVGIKKDLKPAITFED